MNRNPPFPPNPRPLPIDELLPGLRSAFRRSRNAVLTAAPGAGKTTRVPPSLLEEEWLRGKRIVMLEPRRLAAQRSARYMAAMMGGEAGGLVGYRIRGEVRSGPHTRIEVVTEGILTRMLQSDPWLPGTGLLIFDEYHERTIHADVGLALALNVQQEIRPDLRVLVMSATLDVSAVASLLGDAEVLSAAGREYPVETHYIRHPREGPVEPAVASAVVRALHRETGDVLVFLPGRREIGRVEALLDASLPEEGFSGSVRVHPLYGDASQDLQREALSPAPRGIRKVILSTSLAETSLTIDGVRVVVDSGLARASRFDPRRGMAGLVTVPVSRAGADQRRGRAGRQQPGSCYRVWTEQEHASLPPFTQPEILVSDLAPLALDLARWGDPSGAGLRFADVPPPAHISQARALLARLGAIDREGKLTPHGRAMSDLPVHPRLAHMLIRGKELGLGPEACDAAALLEERDPVRGGEKEIDLRSRLRALRSHGAADSPAAGRILSQAGRLRGMIGCGDGRERRSRPGVLLALAYPDRIAQRRGSGPGRYLLASGTGAETPGGSFLAAEPYLAVGEVDGAGSEARIRIAEPIGEEEIRELFSDLISTEEDVRWDEAQEELVARRVTRLGALELAAVNFPPAGEKAAAAVITGIRRMGIRCLPWEKGSESLRARSEWLREGGYAEAGWPDLSETALMEGLEVWLAPHLHGVGRRAHLDRLDMRSILKGLFTSRQLSDLDRLAPERCTVPTGSSVPIGYEAGAAPVLAVRLQEMFGQTETPTVAGGRVRVVLHLLSPARRPLAVTQDLPSFWKNAYKDVRREMRGRYPKHVWPEDPLAAKPTRTAKRRA